VGFEKNSKKLVFPKRRDTKTNAKLQLGGRLRSTGGEVQDGNDVIVECQQKGPRGRENVHPVRGSVVYRLSGVESDKEPCGSGAAWPLALDPEWVTPKNEALGRSRHPRSGGHKEKSPLNTYRSA